MYRGGNFADTAESSELALELIIDEDSISRYSELKNLQCLPRTIIETHYNALKRKGSDDDSMLGD